MNSAAPVFIVGTGRCGSTMLSNMLREHPAVLSLSEFIVFMCDLGGRIAGFLPPGDATAEQVWAILGGFHPRQNQMIRHGVEMDEMIYPLAPDSRFNRETGVPAILQTTLPHITPDHDAFFDRLRAFVMDLGPAPMAVQYSRVFDWMRETFGKRVWAERSGGSLRLVKELSDQFPEARFVHIIRDGRDCAISMSGHHGFRMMMTCVMLEENLGYDPYETEERSGIEDLAEEMYRLLPEHFDPKVFRNMKPSPALFGHYWSGELIKGLPVLAALGPDRVLSLHFEDILARPESCLRRMIEFVGSDFADEEWVRKAAATIRPVKSSWRKLESGELARLEAACQPGFEALETGARLAA